MSSKPPPTPGTTELYLLAAGLLLGVLLGPAVLGRVAPSAHASLFGGGPATQQLIDYEDETAAMVAALRATGVTPDAVGEQIDLRALQGDAIRQARDAVMDRNAMIKLALAFLLLSGVLMAEAAVGGGRVVWTTGRYAVAALGLAIFIARPSLFAAIPHVFGG